MSEYKMDELFRKKLANRKEIPSDAAWNKLSSELRQERSKKTIVYWYVAAGIVFLVGLGYAFFFQSENVEPTQPLAQETPIEIVPPNKTEQEITDPIQEEPLVADNRNDLDEKTDQPEEVATEIENVQLKENNAFGEDKNIAEEEEEEAIVEENDEAPLLAQEVKEIAPEVSADPVVTEEVVETEELLSYHSSNVETEKYPEVVITYKKSNTQEKPEKAFKKIVKLARDITEGEYGLGQLREAKNELLAFDRKKEKNN